jgi:hypothetical protein
LTAARIAWSRFAAASFAAFAAVTAASSRFGSPTFGSVTRPFAVATTILGERFAFVEAFRVEAFRVVLFFGAAIRSSPSLSG